MSQDRQEVDNSGQLSQSAEGVRVQRGENLSQKSPEGNTQVPLDTESEIVFVVVVVVKR